MGKHILGIDISKETFDVALLDDESTYSTGHFYNSRDGFESLGRWLSNRGVDSLHACMESTGRYGDDLAHFLSEAGYDVSVLNPARTYAYGKSKLMRTKTDKADAKLIADYCATQAPPLWNPPTVLQCELQALTRYLNELKSARTREKNRRKSGIRSQAVRNAIDEHIDFLNNTIKQVEEQIEQLKDESDEHREQIELLVSIPAISATTATKILAELPDVSNFPQARQAASYAGLCPRQHESGTSIRKRARMSKTGNPYLREALYMPAVCVMRGSNPLLQPLVERMKAEGRHSMVIIGAIMRKLLHLAYGVLKTGKPFDPNYLSGTVSA
jgi:transposase